MVENLKILKDILQKMESVLIAYSGGVDSSLVVKLSHDLLGERVLAVTAKSPLYPASELKEAKRMAEWLGVRHLIIESDELNPNIARNPRNRCYLCKKELFSRLGLIAKEYGLSYILDGSNASDTNDLRPGMEAAKEFGVISPLAEVGLTKSEIRKLSKDVGLPNWNKPSMSCLASRFPYGKRITRKALKMVEMAEEYIKRQGIDQVRVRHYGSLCRIEVEESNTERILSKKEGILKRLKEIGYVYITLDLGGYRSGSMNGV